MASSQLSTFSRCRAEQSENGMLDSAGKFTRPAGPQRRQLVFAVVWVGEEEGHTQPGPQRTFFVEIIVRYCPVGRTRRQAGPHSVEPTALTLLCCGRQRSLRGG